MQMIARTVFFAVFLACVFVASAEADTVYTFTGGTFNYVTGVYTRGDQVTGSFVLSSSFVAVAAIGPQLVSSGIVSYSFTDGHQTLTQLNSVGNFSVGFNFTNGTPILPNCCLGNTLTGWAVTIGAPTGSIVTEFDSAYTGDFTTAASLGCPSRFSTIPPCPSVAIISDLVPFQDGAPGTWTMQVPEGGSTALFLFIGLAGVTILTRFSGLKRITRGL
jgi:hypothetical protein